jgi:type I restriction enzyme M protein
MSNANQLVQELWNYCNTLRDDGLSFRLHPIPAGQPGDYLQHLAFLLFLKMADAQPRLSGAPSAIPSVKSASSVVNPHA